MPPSSFHSTSTHHPPLAAFTCFLTDQEDMGQGGAALHVLVLPPLPVICAAILPGAHSLIHCIDCGLSLLVCHCTCMFCVTANTIVGIPLFLAVVYRPFLALILIAFHKDAGVNVSVFSCVHNITRLTALCAASYVGTMFLLVPMLR